MMNLIIAEDYEPFLRDYGNKLVKIRKENISGVDIDYIDKLLWIYKLFYVFYAWIKCKRPKILFLEKKP